MADILRSTAVFPDFARSVAVELVEVLRYTPAITTSGNTCQTCVLVLSLIVLQTGILGMLTGHVMHQQALAVTDTQTLHR